MYKGIVLCLLLQGCNLYGGGSVHTFTKDSEFRESMPLVTLGVSEKIDKNLDVYVQHKSQPFIEESGYGLNEMGFKFNVELF